MIIPTASSNGEVRASVDSAGARKGPNRVRVGKATCDGCQARPWEDRRGLPCDTGVCGCGVPTVAHPRETELSLRNRYLDRQIARPYITYRKGPGLRGWDTCLRSAPAFSAAPAKQDSSIGENSRLHLLDDDRIVRTS